MSFIPSFILSALLFCNVTVPGGWDGTTFTEGIYCEIPHVSFTASIDETPLSLRNAAAVFKSEALDLNLAAGSLVVTGLNGKDRLSAELPARTDGSKNTALFGRWNVFAFLVTAGRSQLQLHPGFLSLLKKGSFKAEVQNAVSAGWTRIPETKETDWFLRYPLHQAGNLHYLTDSLTLRFSLAHVRLETAGFISLSLPDIFPASAERGLSLLLAAGNTETSFSGTVTPAFFLTPSGTFSSEQLKADARFTCRNSQSDSRSTIFKAEAGFVQKQPATVQELPRRELSAELAASGTAGRLGAGISAAAAKFSPEDEWQTGELIPSVEFSYLETSVSAKAVFLPLKPASDQKQAAPEWSLKASHAGDTRSASYAADFSGSTVTRQELSLTEKRGSSTFYTTLTIRETGLSWTLSFTRSW